MLEKYKYKAGSFKCNLQNSQAEGPTLATSIHKPLISKLKSELNWAGLRQILSVLQ